MRSKDYKPAGIIFCLIIGFLVISAVVFFSGPKAERIKADRLDDFMSGWQILDNGSYKDTAVPAQVEDVDLGETMVIKNTLPSYMEDGIYLIFRASHQKIKVYIDNALVKSYGWDETKVFGKTPGCAWIMVPLNSQMSGRLVRLEITGVYPQYSGMLNEIYTGDKSAVMSLLIDNQLKGVLVCLILVMAGFMMFSVGIILRNATATSSLKRLGILSVLVGAWSAAGSNMMQLFTGDVYLMLNIEYMLLGLLFPMFLWFLMSLQHYRENRMMVIFFWTSIAEFIFIDILQVTGVADYMQTVVITHVMMFLIMCYMIVSGIVELVRKKAPRDVKVLIFSVIILIMFSGTDIIRFYMHLSWDDGLFTRIGVLVFIYVWASEVISSMSKRFRIIAKAEALQILAYEDLMTGLCNRTAFEELMTKYSIDQRISGYIITFDINNLKEINDCYGHAAGDDAIVRISRIIKNIFAPAGKCYRVGGDEICVMLPKEAEIMYDSIDKALEALSDAVREESEKLGIKLSVAAGYSEVSESDEDFDIYMAYREADRLMYERKKQMKMKRERDGYNNESDICV